MRIKMSGQYRPHDFQDAIDAIVQTLVANGITEFRGAYLYLKTFRDGRIVEFEDQETGAPFEILEFRGRETREFKRYSHRVTPVIEEGKQ